MRTLYAAALAVLATAAASPALPAETLVLRMTASVEYALRNRMQDSDGFWFATYELKGHAFPNGSDSIAYDLSCVGASWGIDASLGGEEAMCRLGEDGAPVLFARGSAVDGRARTALLRFELYGGRGRFAGLDGTMTMERGMDLSGERPTGRAGLMLRLAMVARDRAAE
ncbi:hypothetical protein [Elioraea rosea]|uniref:hypothetical protein n=1 Tax=Elioraea rosea TaxID=2492390 RepID=UPI0011840376|nr:hypothetical protein [Elioraea rosea]